MRKFFLTLIFFTIAVAGTIQAADPYIESVEEITAGNFFGYGARQMAMGGTGMMTIDGTALFYNPANLARIPRIEFNFGLSNQKYQDASTVRPVRRIVENGIIPTATVMSGRFAGFTSVAGSADNSKTNTRINSAILSIPYPTYRGSLVIGLGVVRTADFDRVFDMYFRDDTASGGHITGAGHEFQSGGLYQWGAGFGLDLSPRVSFGGMAYVYTGKHEYNWEYALDSVGVYDYHFQQYIEDKYLGFGGKIGLAMQLSQYIGLGLAVESPVVLNVEENSTNESQYPTDSGRADDYWTNYVEYDVKRPFVFSAGMTARIQDATLALDIDYTDWSQLAYGDNADMETENSKIKTYYKDALRFRLGGEYVFPELGLSLRGGFFSDPLPIKSEFQNRSRYGYTLGFGLLVDQVMTIDFAYLHGSYGRNSDFTYASSLDGQTLHNFIIDENIKYNRLYLTAAYRF
ncbi:exported hypothetical protein [Candidatus Zixiibacteriota bacterium]|nr:exported hypothetical protein [candidate division Zixibacteria bacterium]